MTAGRQMSTTTLWFRMTRARRSMAENKRAIFRGDAPTNTMLALKTRKQAVKFSSRGKKQFRRGKKQAWAMSRP